MPKRRANGEGNIRKRKDGRWEGRYTAGYDPESGKRNCYQKVIICPSEPRRLIFDYCGAIFALPEAFFFCYSGAIFERSKVSFH